MEQEDEEVNVIFSFLCFVSKKECKSQADQRYNSLVKTRVKCHKLVCWQVVQAHKFAEIAEVAAMDVGEEAPVIAIPEKQKWLKEHPYVPIPTL